MTSRLPYGQAAINQAYNSYRCRANKRNMYFNLTVDEFVKIAKQPCYYCGDSNTNLKVNKSGNGDFSHNGLDRVNNNVGYFVKNCVSCCIFCNGAKGKLSQAKFLEKIEKIYNYQKKKRKFAP